MKKLSLYIFLIFFTTNVTAKEIVMKCKFKKYNYISQDSGDIILSTNKKGKAKWVRWCPGEKTEDNKDWFVSAKNRELIISDLKGICMIEKGEFLNGEDGEQILALAESEDFEFAEVDDLGEYTENNTYLHKHIQEVLNLELVDADAIRKANFKKLYSSYGKIYS